MALPLDWRTDPMVLIEADLLPLLSQVPSALCRRAIDDARNADIDPDLSSRIQRFAALTESGFDELLRPTGFPLDDDGRAICAEAARLWHQLLSQWTNWSAPTLLDHFQNDCVPQSLACLDTVRRVFIGGVLRRQASHADLSDAALTELARLSRSIQFVAINASIEAARCGPQGKAFALIAEEIRHLARQSGSVIEAQKS